METTKLYKALANFQQEVPVIHKATQGYGYSYADLPAIFEVINPLLQKHGLGFTQLIQGKAVETIIFHVETGETITSITDIPEGVQLKGMNDFQVLGSAITYIRRYSLSSALGLVTDKDTDAGGQQAPQSKPNIKTIPAAELNRVSKALAEVSDLEELQNLFKNEKLANTPSVKQMFTVKKLELQKLQSA